MTDAQFIKNAAYQNAMTACALVELEAMKAENSQRAIEGKSMAYTENQFMELIIKHQIGHNAVVTNLNQDY